MIRPSIRSRLTLWYGAALGLILVLFSVGGLLFEYYTRGHTSPTF